MKKFFQKLITAISTFFNKLPAELKKAVNVAVVVTENFKSFVDSPGADILTALIPGNADDKVKEILRQSLPSLVIGLNMVKNSGYLSTPEEILKVAAGFLQRLPDGPERTKALQNLSGAITELAADGKFDWADSVYLTKWYFKNKFKAA